MKNEKNRFASFFEEPIIDKSYFDDLCDTFRSPNIWKKTNDGWSLRKTVDNI